HAPLTPMVSFIQSYSNSITRGVADYGKFYFFGGNILYAINATNGALVWSKNIMSPPQTLPVVATGMLIYSNSTNITAINPNTNSIIWTSNTFNSITASTPPVIYNGKIYIGGSSPLLNANVFAFYLNNGTRAWAFNSGNAPNSLAIDYGSIIASYPKTVSVVEDQGSSANSLWTHGYSSSSPAAASSYNSLIAFQSGSSANALYLNGTASPGFPFGVVFASTKPTVYNNTIIYQTSNAIITASANGVSNSVSQMPASYGTGMVNNFPVAGSKLIYSTWSKGYLVAQNRSNLQPAWVTNTPYTGKFNISAIAYGKLYTAIGGNLIVYGACATPSSGSLLSIAATLYLNGQGSCADALIDYAYPMSNYSIFINNTFAPAMNIASFTGTNSYIENPYNALVSNDINYTVTAWVDPASLPASNSVIYSEGTPGATLLFTINSNGNLAMAAKNGATWINFTSSFVVPTNKWSFVVFQLSNGGAGSGNFKIYLNSQSQQGSGQQGTSTASFYTMGYNVGSLGASGKPFAYTGSIANLEVYNSLLNQNKVINIYQGGVQGAPMQNSNLVAWYPLDGDANDYGGSYNTAYPVNVLFVSGNYLPAGFQGAVQVSRAGASLPITNYTTGITRLFNVSVVSWR
ncbi:MAG: PQQ-binding-like beta-propeller repeat protein, partial [Candidatus Micrarchaeota archaeon]|nr:PQQ-binding-like beta-propeller repeat protein [Candidatus Micrarchaeota archaeon]